MKMKLSVIPYLAALSAIIVFSYNVKLRHAGDIPSYSGSSVRVANNNADNNAVATVQGSSSKGRRSLKGLDAEQEAYLEKRVNEVFQTTWPRCVEERLTAIECKLFIDEEIWNTFTGLDKYIRVIIKDKRSGKDTWYNSVVIYIDDNDKVVGRDGDGMIYYDFLWEGSGVPATPDDEKEVPPVLATQTEAGSPLADPATDPRADPTSPLYEPLYLEINPVLVVGASVGGAAAGSDSNPIGGGVVTDPNVPNEPEGDDKLNQAKLDDEAARNPDGSIKVEVAGTRSLPPFDCSGMTGYNCCLMIKLKIRDLDDQGKAIQCTQMYEDGTDHDKYWLNMRGKKVFVFANHDDIVSKIPKLRGGWPKGKSDEEFFEWLEDGGDPNVYLYQQ